jgi:hypothetical protein
VVFEAQEREDGLNSGVVGYERGGGIPGAVDRCWGRWGCDSLSLYGRFISFSEKVPNSEVRGDANLSRETTGHLYQGFAN